MTWLAMHFARVGNSPLMENLRIGLDPRSGRVTAAGLGEVSRGVDSLRKTFCPQQRRQRIFSAGQTVRNLGRAQGDSNGETMGRQASLSQTQEGFVSVMAMMWERKANAEKMMLRRTGVFVFQREQHAIRGSNSVRRQALQQEAGRHSLATCNEPTIWMNRRFGHGYFYTFWNLKIGSISYSSSPPKRHHIGTSLQPDFSMSCGQRASKGAA
ncbi:hypothetical protein M409DRAFT_56753 [Zasmidium cellare ATCC 36951]|uniref:Uncharacterized protein n=1 Tax=Zasmidium cellare ATCC 36951 TaxID=1080233 RepID=A0A6A6CBG1_ZASCE|nr:uncharacterized protein M409DRAFT_56753 [Zasmidium cellare ATCC 36951]KAF2164494.1 hypothetical protein M409DRAFT_56753 [Zasmidium cellare ATCC 36951]